METLENIGKIVLEIDEHVSLFFDNTKPFFLRLCRLSENKWNDFRQFVFVVDALVCIFAHSLVGGLVRVCLTQHKKGGLKAPFLIPKINVWFTKRGRETKAQCLERKPFPPIVANLVDFF